MERTPLLDLPLIMPSQAQQHVTYNEALMTLDGICQLSVIDRDLATRPANPANGDRYIVADGATGAWSGWDRDIALCVDGAWVRLEPRAGWMAWVQDEQLLLGWNGSTWMNPAGTGSSRSFSLIGVNASADATNRLAVAGDAALFSHDNVTPGTGDMRIKANKAAAGNTASFLFQTGWSGRAEFGLAGDDDFHIKVSADGTTWNEALVIDGNTGAVSIPNSSFAPKILTAEGTSGTSMANLVYTDQTWDATTRNDFGGGAWNGTTFTAPEDGVYDISASLGVNGSPSGTSIYFYRNGTTEIGFSEIMSAGGQNTILSRAVLSLNASDTILVRMRHVDGSSQSGLAASVFSIVKLI